MSLAQESEGFGRFRSLFCPVRKSELRLFLPLLLIFFFICFDYNILRAAKDSLVVTAPSSGAETIPFIKVWVILPMALLMTFLFTRLSSRWSTEKMFYSILAVFLGFFLLFTLVLYPLRDLLHPHAYADFLESVLPLGFKGLIALVRNWTYTCFYIMAELWGTMVMTVLFWSFVNEMLSVNIAKRFYVLILMGGNLSAVFAGMVSTFASKVGKTWGVSLGLESWQCSLLLLNGFVVVGGVLAILVFRWLSASGGVNPSSQATSLKQPSSEFKMGLRKNFHYLAQSKYLLCIATIVVTYNICANLTEVTWKDQLLHLCSNPNDFNAYMGKVTMWIGIMGTLIAVISGTIIRRLNWTFNAMIPPLTLLITGIGFFSFLIFKESPLGIAFAAFLGSTPHTIGVFFGSTQQCLSRASKYTLLDATKELAFIPLSKESKLKGKAAIDGVGSRFGKSGGALIYQALLMCFGTVSLTVPYVGVTLLFVIAAWIVAVVALGRRFNLLTSQPQSA